MTSEGFIEVASALIKAINYDSEHGNIIRLEELCLRDTKLDSKCLQALGKVVKVATRELRDLDLSDNLITITTSEEVAAWEDFLTSFSECYVLRRIDLSGNALGPRAFEVIAKVYGKEPLIDIMSLEEVDIDRQNDISVLEYTLSERFPFQQRINALSVEEGSEGSTNNGDSDSHATSEVLKAYRHGLSTSLDFTVGSAESLYIRFSIARGSPARHYANRSSVISRINPRFTICSLSHIV